MFRECGPHRKLLIPDVKTCSTTVSPGIAAAKCEPLKVTGRRLCDCSAGTSLGAGRPSSDLRTSIVYRF